MSAHRIDIIHRRWRRTQEDMELGNWSNTEYTNRGGECIALCMVNSLTEKGLYRDSVGASAATAVVLKYIRICKQSRIENRR